jgi:hypothetical protein
MHAQNDLLVLISGESGTGKSASLQNLPNQEGVMYLNCEAGKRLPFRNKFQTYIITDPYQVHEAFDHAKDNPAFHTIVVDTLTFLLDMFETQYVLAAADTQKAWGNFQQFFKILMQEKVASSDKSVIFLAHTRSELDPKAMEMRTAVPVKGALKNNGLEAYFSTVVSTKKVSIKDLEKVPSPLLNITEQERILGFKHVFQTQLTKDTIGERIRSPMGLFEPKEPYMDNDAAKLLQHLHEYYAAA